MNYNKKTINDVDVKGKKVLLRCDVNVPQDKETGEIVPTDGRCRKRSPSYKPSGNEQPMPKTMKALKEEVLRLREENAALKEQLRALR